MHQGLGRRPKNDKNIAGKKSFPRRGFRTELSECLDILLKSFVYEAVMSIGKAVRGGTYDPMMLLSGQMTTFVVI